MLRFVYAALCLGVAAVAVPSFINDNPDIAREAAGIARPDMPQQQRQNAVKTVPDGPVLSGTERIQLDRTGHYVADFRLNNHRVQGLIDTGASAIAINETTARQAGLRLSQGDFVYRVQTANGETRAARAVLDTVTIGSIRVRDVDTLVLEDKSLSTVLIGMSFMNRLRSFEYANGALVLRR